jgi:BirA family transcriptional regulator, biotin operon repressor / biotin---[acetyl-CoA-carboxylase] ligase
MRNCLFYHSLDSTVKEYERLSRIGGSEDRWIIRSGEQSAGMGRDGNAWFSPPGSLYLSFDFLYPEPVPSFSLYVGHCLHELLSSLFPLRDLAIKWPNDLYLAGAKLGGVLCKYQPQENKYIISIGINTNIQIHNVSHQYDVAILNNAIGFNISNSVLAELIVKTVEGQAGILGTPSSYIDYCNSCLYGMGMAAEVFQADSTARGRISGISSDGSISLIDASGVTRNFYSGSLRILAGQWNQAFS